MATGINGGSAPMSEKQERERERKVFEVNRHNTEVYNKIFMARLEIDGLNLEPEQFSPDRNQALYWTIR